MTTINPTSKDSNLDSTAANDTPEAAPLHQVDSEEKTKEAKKTKKKPKLEAKPEAQQDKDNFLDDKPIHDLADQWQQAYIECFGEQATQGFSELSQRNKDKILSKLNAFKKSNDKAESDKTKALKAKAKAEKLAQLMPEREINYQEVTRELHPANTINNLAHLVSCLGYQPAFNEMTLEVELLQNGLPIKASIDQKRSKLISAASISGLPKSTIDDHLTALCENYKYHPVRYILDRAGQWDGVKRVGDVIDCLNAKDKKLARISISKWLVSAVAALYEDRFKTKNVPVLQGEQSYMKTAFIEKIASICDCSFLEGAELDPDSRDSITKAIKAWIVELGELERTSRNSQGSIKAFITQRIDTVRLPYGKSETRKRRQTVFIATVNGTDFLRDESGSDRYTVLEMAGKVNVDRLNEILGLDYDNGREKVNDHNLLIQFWLEVKHQYEQGASWILTDDEKALFKVANSEHQFKDDMRYLLEDYISDADNMIWRWMKASDICSRIEVRPEKSRQVGRALKAMANDGLIQGKKGRANVTLYWMPYTHKHTEEN